MVRALKEYLNRFVQLSDAEFEEIMAVAEVRTYDKKIKLIDKGEKKNTSISSSRDWPVNIFTKATKR